MRKFLAAAIGFAAITLATAPASAADMAVKAPPPAPLPVIYDWSGFYIGINGGGGSSRKCWDFVDATGVVTGVPGALAAEGCHNAVGGTVGGQIGYRWQTTNWVFGFEGQGNWADFTGDNTSLIFGADRNRSRIDSFGLITGQIGYAWNNVLLYVKGGAAVVGDRYDVFDIPTGALFSSARETRWGGTVGAGLEFGFAQNWSVGVEYNHIFLGDRTIDFTTPAGVFAGSDRIRQDVDMGLVRLNYKFGGPLMARY